MPEFMTVTLIGLLAIINPGPNFAIVTKTSLIYGRRAGLFAALGVGAANFCHVTLNLIGIGIIISQSLLLFTILKIFGAGYLLYIGYRGLTAKVSQASTNNDTYLQSSMKQPRVRHAFFPGLLIGISNPMACLFYLSFFSLILSDSIPITLQVFYGIWLSLLACLWFALVALLFTHSYMGGAHWKKIKHWIERVTGGVLVLLAIQLLRAAKMSL